MQIGLNIFVTAQVLPAEGIVLPQLVSGPTTTGDGFEGSAISAMADDSWTYENAQAVVALREYRLMIDGTEVVTPQAAASVSVPLGTAGGLFMMQMRVQVGAAPGIWSAWRTISAGTITGVPLLSNPTGTQDGETDYTGAVTTNSGGGTLYWTVTNTNAAPSVGALKSAESQAVSAPGEQSVSGNGLAANTSYHIHFLQEDGNGRDSDIVSSAPFTTDAPQATSPASFGVGDWSVADLATGGDARVAVTGLPDDGGSPITAIEYRIGTGAWLALGGATTGTYDLTDHFTDDLSTQMRLRAINAVGASAQSAAKSVTTTTAATAPARMAAPSLGASQTVIAVTLAADPANGGSAITGRDIRHSTDQGTWTIVTDVASPHDISDLTPGTAYFVQARAANAVGAGPWSMSANATTPAVPVDTTAPLVNASGFSNGIVTVDLIEASGSATAVWATADLGTDPTFTIGGGWSGSTYQTGSFAVSSGGDSDTIPIDSATPDGSRELTLYFFDASDNLSTPERLAITVNRVPNLSNVSATQTGQTTASWGVTSDLAGGTIHVGVRPVASAALTAAQLVAGSGGAGVVFGTDATPSADASNGGSFTGLSAATRYVVDAVQVAGGVTGPVGSSDAFTTAAPASGLSLVQNIPGGSSSANETVFQSNSITIGSGLNRALVVPVALNDTSNTADLATLRATFGAADRTIGTGSAMTLFGPYSNSGSTRTNTAFAILLNPPTGAGTVQIDNTAETWGSISTRLYEYTGARQTIGAWAALQAGGSTGTSVATSGPVAAGDLISVLCLLSGDYRAEIAASGAATLDATANDGTSGFSDHTAAFSREARVTAGSNGNGFTWTTSAMNDMATLSVPEA